ncbi:MAG: redoxin family protein [Chthonomonas sp.]|nr:redoxin family protein [Chthonomonas sp.]
MWPKSALRSVGIACVLASSVLAIAAAPSIGSPAPALKVSSWAKGTPVTTFKKGSVYVVEFWATWCGPCKQSIPHLTELAKEFKGKVTFIGVSVWERGNDIPGVVKKFVDEMGDKMAYNVALDDGTTMAETWMKAYSQRGIPAAFIVNGEGKIAWIGHPMDDLGETLTAVLAGKHNIAEQKARFEEERAREAKEAAIDAELKQARDFYAAGSTDKAIEIWNRTMKDSPARTADVVSERLVAVHDKDRALVPAEIAGFAGSDDVRVAEGLAMYSLMVTMKSKTPVAEDQPLITAAADAADKVNKDRDPYVLYYLAQLSYLRKDFEQAQRKLDKAIEVTPGSRFKDDPGFLDFLQKAKLRFAK